jgi:hypothetical protein
MQETGGAFGMSGGGEYRPLVVLQDRQPVGNIAGRGRRVAPASGRDRGEKCAT